VDLVAVVEVQARGGHDLLAGRVRLSRRLGGALDQQVPEGVDELLEGRVLVGADLAVRRPQAPGSLERRHLLLQPRVEDIRRRVGLRPEARLPQRPLDRADIAADRSELEMAWLGHQPCSRSFCTTTRSSPSSSA
jgi:hypothetical protein